MVVLAKVTADAFHVAFAQNFGRLYDMATRKWIVENSDDTLRI